MALDMSEFTKVGAAKANTKGDNFRDGYGLAVIEELIYDRMNDGLTFVARCKILESNSKGDFDPVTKQPVQPNAVGSQVGWPQKVEKHKSAVGNVKSFVLALLGEDESAVTPDQFGKALFDLTQGKEQPARGMVIKYSTYQQAVRATGKVNTYVGWSTAEGNTPEKIAARRKALDEGKEVPK